MERRVKWGPFDPCCSESLAGLATSDPEFFQYLRDNDHTLLEFRDSEEEEEMEDRYVLKALRKEAAVDCNTNQHEYTFGCRINVSF